MDLKKELKALYAPSAKAVSLLEIPTMPYIMLDGAGDPNTSQEYMDAVSALYPVAYGIRAVSKAAGQVFTVMPLEGLWWWKDMENHAQDFVLNKQDKADFLWTMMILQPSHITPEIFEQARETVRKKNPRPALDRMRFEVYHEGHVAQILHIGSYDAEGENIQKLHEAIINAGYQLSGKHHEIYLSDPRKVAPEKLKTIIRQPFSK